MSLKQRVAVALYGEHAAESEPCMEAAGKALGVVADWLTSQEAHDICCLAVKGWESDVCPALWDGQRALAKAVRRDATEGVPTEMGVESSVPPQAVRKGPAESSSTSGRSEDPEGEMCPKCGFGHMTGPQYHVAGEAQFVGAFKIGPKGEHLCFTCSTCGFQEERPCRDAGKAKED